MGRTLSQGAAHRPFRVSRPTGLSASPGPPASVATTIAVLELVALIARAVGKL
ncbi:hypothetical protein [Streptomyces cyaneofuscatus]|uniref:hypothetical protein n=1 Tax=Streptomyces cyaneofuscatus TaxID=66883 RepID=UPI0036484A12